MIQVLCLLHQNVIIAIKIVTFTISLQKVFLGKERFVENLFKLTRTFIDLFFLSHMIDYGKMFYIFRFSLIQGM